VIWLRWGDDGKKIQYKAEHLSHTSPLSTPFFYTCCTCLFARWELSLQLPHALSGNASSPLLLSVCYSPSVVENGWKQMLYRFTMVQISGSTTDALKEKRCLQCLFCYAVNTWIQKPFTHEFIINSHLFWKCHFWLSLNWRFGWVHGSSDIYNSCNNSGCALNWRKRESLRKMPTIEVATGRIRPPPRTLPVLPMFFLHSTSSSLSTNESLPPVFLFRT